MQVFIFPRKRFCPSANKNKTYKQRKFYKKSQSDVFDRQMTIVIVIVKHFIAGNYDQERFNNQTCH